MKLNDGNADSNLHKLPKGTLANSKQNCSFQEVSTGCNNKWKLKTNKTTITKNPNERQLANSQQTRGKYTSLPQIPHKYFRRFPSPTCKTSEFTLPLKLPTQTTPVPITGFLTLKYSRVNHVLLDVPGMSPTAPHPICEPVLFIGTVGV